MKSFFMYFKDKIICNAFYSYQNEQQEGIQKLIDEAALKK